MNPTPNEQVDEELRDYVLRYLRHADDNGQIHSSPLILEDYANAIMEKVAHHTKVAVEAAEAKSRTTDELLNEYFRLKSEDKAIRAERNEYMQQHHCLSDRGESMRNYANLEDYEANGGDCIERLKASSMGTTLCEVCEKRNDWFIRRQAISHKRAAIMQRLKRLAVPQQSTSPDERSAK